MALGMAKDSMVDLQSLAQEKNESKLLDDGGADDMVSLLTTGQSRGSIGEYKKLVPLDLIGQEKDGVVPSIELDKAKEMIVSSNNSGGGGDGDGNSSSSSPAKAVVPLGSQDIEEEKKQDPAAGSVVGQYSGFQTDYEDYNYDAYPFQYHQNPQTVLGGPKPSSGSFLCCLFPWLRTEGRAQITEHGEKQQQQQEQDEEEKEQDEEEKEQDNSIAEPITDKAKTLRRASSSGDDDDVSTGEMSVGSDKLGERLSDKDRQAVLARLRLAQPDRAHNSPGGGAAAGDTTGSPGSSDKDNNKVKQKGLLNEIPNLPLEDDQNDSKSDISTGSGSGPKGILKRQSTVVKTTEAELDMGGSRRRSLFPTYETTNKKKNDNHVTFSPMARVVTVKSQKDMTPEEKSAIWWQRWDYEDFRKTGRIITRAMLEGGSEIWLASNQSWLHMGASKSATLKNAMSLSDKAAKNGANGASKNKNDTADLIQTTGDKWWHKFGHSRRGLEHIASIKEGSERQANVRHAIRAVLDEQRRQKTYLREDPEKLRMVSLHNTSWARDLAVAAGESDADAVKSNFNEERKSREFYLLKMAHSNNITSKGKHVPAFMQPAMTTFSPKLDANTSAQIMYRRKQQRIQSLQQKESAESPASIPTQSPSKKDKPPAPATRSMEPIHDPEPDPGHHDLAKRAAGFSHDGAEQVNMAAVLSGMGAIPKIAQPV